MQGAGETTSSYLEMFIMLLVQFPEVQKKAQEELDRVVGPNRTPTLKDVDKMPYIRAIIAEVTLKFYSFVLNITKFIIRPTAFDQWSL